MCSDVCKKAALVSRLFVQTVKESLNQLIRKERFPKENHQGFLLASQMCRNATSHGLHSSATARQKDFFDTLCKKAALTSRLFVISG